MPARWRACGAPRCPNLTEHPSGKCDAHRTDDRPSAARRGYGPAHQRLRARWAPKVAAGLVRCARCGEQIRPDDPWDLGHVDGDRSRYAGPEHARCNRQTSTHRAAREA